MKPGELPAWFRSYLEAACLGGDVGSSWFFRAADLVLDLGVLGWAFAAVARVVLLAFADVALVLPDFVLSPAAFADRLPAEDRLADGAPSEMPVRDGT